MRRISISARFTGDSSSASGAFRFARDYRFAAWSRLSSSSSSNASASSVTITSISIGALSSGCVWRLRQTFQPSRFSRQRAQCRIIQHQRRGKLHAPAMTTTYFAVQPPSTNPGQDHAAPHPRRSRCSGSERICTVCCRRCSVNSARRSAAARLLQQLGEAARSLFLLGCNKILAELCYASMYLSTRLKGRRTRRPLADESIP